MSEEIYSDRWQTASFRGVEFRVESHEAKYGRRLAVHEYPWAELPNPEDLGGKAGEWSVSAYFIGLQYDVECNDLLAVLNQAGADWLIHPWLGRLWVCAQTWSRHESIDKNGFCSLTINFVAGGEAPQYSETDPIDEAVDECSLFADESEADFDLEDMSSDAFDAFVETINTGMDYLRQGISMATLPLTWAQQVMNFATNLQSELGALMALPGAYAGALRGLMDLVGFGADDYPAVADEKKSRGVVFSETDRLRLVTTLSKQALLPVVRPTAGIAASDGKVRRNLLREQTLRSRLLLVSAANVALTQYQSEAARDAALRLVLATFDALLPTMTDTVFESAVSARKSFMQALLAQDLRPVDQRDVVSALPSTVLAHRLSVAEATFIAQNAVRHPLFVQGRVHG